MASHEATTQVKQESGVEQEAPDKHETLAQSLRCPADTYSEILKNLLMPYAAHNCGIYLATGGADEYTMKIIKGAVEWANEIPTVIGAPIRRMQAAICTENNVIVFHWGNSYLCERDLWDSDFSEDQLYEMGRSDW